MLTGIYLAQTVMYDFERPLLSVRQNCVEIFSQLVMITQSFTYLGRLIESGFQEFVHVEGQFSICLIGSLLFCFIEFEDDARIVQLFDESLVNLIPGCFGRPSLFGGI